MKFRHLFLVILVTVTYYTAHSQKDFFKSYSNFYTGDPSKIVQLPDSGYIMFYVYNPSSSDQALRRFDKNGNVIWSRYINLSSSESVGQIILTKNKDLVFTGVYANNKINVFRMDLSGNFKFQKTYSGLVQATTPAADCGIIEADNSDFYLFSKDAITRIDSMGTLKWARGLPISGLELRTVHQVSKNNFMALGSVNNLIEGNSASDLVQISFDTTGATKYIKVYGAASNEVSCGGTAMSNGRFFHFFRYDFFKEKENGIGVICTDTLGNQLWTKIIKSSDYGYPNVTTLKDGGVACLYWDGTNSALMKLNDAGTIESNSAFITANLSFNNCALYGTSDGGLILTPIQSGNFSLLKLPPNLNSKCKSMVFKSRKVNFITFDESNLPNYGPGGSLTSATTSATLTNLAFSVLSNSCTSTCGVSSNFVQNTLNVCVGSSITFSNTSVAATSYTWKVNNTIVANTTNLSHQFISPGLYTIALYATGSCVDSIKKIVTVDGNTLPDFTYSKSFLKVRFIPTMYIDNSKYVWDFGDGCINKFQDSVWHCYNSLGNYSVTLSVSNTCGNFQKQKTIALEADVSYTFNKEFDDYSISNMDQYGGAVVQSQDGGYYVGGIDNSYGSSGWDGIVTKLNVSGDHLWSRIITINPGSSQHEINYLSKTHDGGLLFSGCAWNTANFHGVGKLDSAGIGYVLRFGTSSSSEKPGECLELENGNALYCGSRSGVGYLLEVSKLRKINFFRGYSFFKGITSVKKGEDNAYYVYGINNTSTAPALMKLDTNFNFIWAKSIAISNTIALSGGMEVSKSGKIYLTGKINTTNFNAKMFVLCVDTACNVLWTNSYSRLGNQYGRSIGLNSKGDLYISSSNFQFATSNSANYNIFKLDTLGNLKKSFASSSSNGGLCLTYDDGVAIAGTSQSFFNSLEYSINLTKLDSSAFSNCQSNATTVTITPTTATVSVITGTVNTAVPAYTVSPIYITYQLWDSTRCSSFVITNVSDQYPQPDFSLFPNPANSSFTLLSESIIEKVEVINIHGQVQLINYPSSEKCHLSVENIDSGVYFVKVYNVNKLVSIRKLIIQK